jgi:TPP-dependent pyruvate/acetoin dehydrogenase alpha subunit
MLKQRTPDQASTKKEEKPDPLARFKKSLNASRALQETKLAEGVQGINQYVEDVEGDWLEKWDAPEE